MEKSVGELNSYKNNIRKTVKKVKYRMNSIREYVGHIDEELEVLVKGIKYENDIGKVINKVDEHLFSIKMDAEFMQQVLYEIKVCIFKANNITEDIAD